MAEKKLSVTAQRMILTNKIIANIEETLTNEDNYDVFGDIYRTGENNSTFTFKVGEIDGKEILGSLKFTLHKSGFNLDDEIEKFEGFYEDKLRKDKEREGLAYKRSKEEEDRLAAIERNRLEREKLRAKLNL